MEVLTQTSMVPPPSPYSNSSRKAPSLLDRRSSAQKLFSPEPQVAPPMIPVAVSSHSLLAAQSSLFVSNTHAVGTTLRAPRATTSSLLPFVPLTPIMASPRMTPDIGTGSGQSEVVGADGGVASGSGGALARQAEAEAAASAGDYLTRGRPPSSTPSLLPTPTWASTPPTPPSRDKLLAPGRPQTCNHGEPGASADACTRSRVRQPRPASVSILPQYRPPTSPSMNRYDAHASSSRPSFISRSVSPPRASLSIPRSSSHDDIYVGRKIKRRRTQPSNLSSVSPPPRFVEAQGNPQATEVDEDTSDSVLLPSLSRSPRNRTKNMLPALQKGREDSVSSARTRPMFTLGDGDTSDNECDGLLESTSKPETPPEEVRSPDDDERHLESKKAGVKRYHALLELLSTEVGYLLDLRALVSIYLEQLPSLTAPVSTLSRPSPSALSISSLGLSRPFPSSRSAFLNAAPLSVGLGPPDTTERHGFDREREAEKPTRRALFSEQDLRLLRRNAQGLLAWHEQFVALLERALFPIGYGWVFVKVSERRGRGLRSSSEDVALQRVDEAVSAVLELFMEEVSSFEVYELFCPGHNEAANLVRHVQDHYPVEWDSYEQRCSLLVAHTFDFIPDSPRQHGTMSSSSSGRSIDSLGKRRRHSMSSLAMPPPMAMFGGMPLPSSNLNMAMMAAPQSDPTDNHKRKSSGDPADSSSQAMRLKFLDYLIKPVQRICKYPMLLDQLKSKATLLHAPRTAELAERANTAMRTVVTRVDRASEKQAHRLKSTLIASRLIANGPASPISPDGSAERRLQLSTDFLQSLGACLVAGALDVVYHNSNGAVRAKYLAAFLYVGGYLILAKVPKGGKVYEAKHWFPLAGFQILDETEDDASLPYAFHVYNVNVHLHFAASCQLEKTIWIAAIQDALSASPPAWVNEPLANFPSDARSIVTPCDETAVDWSTPLPTPLPTIQSMSELESPDDPTSPTPSAPSPRKLHKTMSRVDSAIMRHEHHNMSSLNRRTSTSSVKAFFAPLTFESRVSRPSSQIRQQVDNGIHDVISDPFVTVRSQVRMHDEELFQLRKKSGNIARSNSGLTLSSAFAPRKRLDSTAFSSSRRKGSLDGVPDVTNDYETVGKSVCSLPSKRSKSSGGKRKSRQPLSVVPFMSQDGPECELSLVQSPDTESPPEMTQSSSATSSNVNSVLPSPLDMNMPLPTPASMDTLRYKPKRTRSLVDNVRSFFHSRSISPSHSSNGSPKVIAVTLEGEVESHGSLVKWLRKGSLRRRVQSSPEVLVDDSAPVTPAASSEDGAYSELTNNSSTNVTSSPMANPDESPERRLTRNNSRRVAFSSVAPIMRRRSLFVSSSHSEDRSPMQLEHGQSLSRSKTLKNIFQFQRSNSLTPMDPNTS